tara:strand:- start:1272 stop:1874 length:603 start_codon:yes stop_codon:yes gene_type:complete
MSKSNIYPISKSFVSRNEKEYLIGSKSGVFWLFGLSGSGKSTLAMELEKKLHSNHIYSIILDGDDLRSGLNQDLGFSVTDRRENIRRVSELAKTLCHAGQVTIVSCITPKNEFRETAKDIIGIKNFHGIYVKASYSECAKRDVKGLYAKASADEIESFTGKQSDFEEPENTALILDTEKEDIDDSLNRLYSFVNRMIQIK